MFLVIEWSPFQFWAVSLVPNSIVREKYESFKGHRRNFFTFDLSKITLFLTYLSN